MAENGTIHQAPDKLKLLVLIVNRNKAEYYLDLLQDLGLSASFSTQAEGTAQTEMLQMLGFGQTEKELILSVVTETRAHAVLETLEEKFSTIRNGKGIALTVPFSAMVGLNAYRFSANTK